MEDVTRLPRQLELYGCQLQQISLDTRHLKRYILFSCEKRLEHRGIAIGYIFFDTNQSYVFIVQLTVFPLKPIC